MILLNFSVLKIQVNYRQIKLIKPQNSRHKNALISLWEHIIQMQIHLLKNFKQLWAPLFLDADRIQLRQSLQNQNQKWMFLQDSIPFWDMLEVRD